MRKIPIEKGQVYQVYTRSIAEFKIFRDQTDYKRMLDTIYFYTPEKNLLKFSDFLLFSQDSKERILSEIRESPKQVKVISYCLMPTHVHLMIEELRELFYIVPKKYYFAIYF